MKKPAEVLRKVEALPIPKHVFVLPDWARPGTLDSLIEDGYLTCAHHQRDRNGSLQVAMNLEITPKGERLLRTSSINWPQLALKGSLAGASLTLMSLLVLYLA